MPNWTWNTITLEGDESDIRRLLIDIGVDEDAPVPSLKFSDLIPEPKGLHKLPDEPDPNFPKLILPAWYIWRRKHWGTKWEPDSFKIEKPGPGKRWLSFNTAWDAPRAYAFGFVNKANFHNVLVWWTANHEDPPDSEETIVKPIREAV